MTTATRYDRGSVTVWLSVGDAERDRCLDTLRAAGLPGEVRSEGPPELRGLVVAHVPHGSRPTADALAAATSRVTATLAAADVAHEVRGTGFAGAGS